MDSKRIAQALALETKGQYFQKYSDIAKTPAIYYLTDKQVAKMYPQYAQGYQPEERQRLIRQKGRWENYVPSPRQLVYKGYDKEIFDFIRHFITEQPVQQRRAKVTQMEKLVQQQRKVIQQQNRLMNQRQERRIAQAKRRQQQQTRPPPVTPQRPTVAASTRRKRGYQPVQDPGSPQPKPNPKLLQAQQSLKQSPGKRAKRQQSAVFAKAMKDDPFAQFLTPFGAK
jgi:hypothetical protein